MFSWIDIVIRVFPGLTMVVALSALLCLPAQAATKPWSTLTPVQQEALAPVAQEWNTMPEKQQQRLLAATQRYPRLSPDQKQRFMNRLTEWSKLTPEQRNRAREKYKAFSKVPPEKREEIKRMVRQSEAEKISSPAASSPVPTADK